MSQETTHRGIRPLRKEEENISCQKSKAVEVPKSRPGKRKRSASPSDYREGKRKNLESSKSRIGQFSQDVYVESWLEQVSSCTSLSSEGTPLFQGMPQRQEGILPSPSGSSRGSSASRKSTASVHDRNYRTSLKYRNIHINREKPSAELLQRTCRIISRPRSSPELDDATALAIGDEALDLEDKAEATFVQKVVPKIMPYMEKVPDTRLEVTSGQTWVNATPVPLAPTILANPLPLPKPQPDLCYGYAETPFSVDQQDTISILAEDKVGLSYAKPNDELLFPYLNIEFKSAGKDGTHPIATNQVAGAGAIVSYGNLQLSQRAYGDGHFDFDEPQFFSISMDQMFAQVNVHWVSQPVPGQYYFHIRKISRHLLDDPVGVRAIQRALKNILDYGANNRLRKYAKHLTSIAKFLHKRSFRRVILRHSLPSSILELRHRLHHHGSRRGRLHLLQIPVRLFKSSN